MDGFDVLEAGGGSGLSDATSPGELREGRLPSQSWPPGVHQVSDQQLAAWRLFLGAHAGVIRRLEADLLAEHQLPLASYDVLVQLVEAPEHRLRMTELASASCSRAAG